MKITKNGVPASERVWVGTCRSCKSEAEAQESEMTHITYDPRERISFSWEKCPVCNIGGDTGYGGMLFHPKFNINGFYESGDI
jgi:hypothetical protein